MALLMSAILSPMINLAQQIKEMKHKYRYADWYKKGSNIICFSPNMIASFQPKNSNQTSTIRVGSDFDYSFCVFNNFSLGAGLHYSHFFLSNHDANVYKLKIFIEYFFLSKRKLSPYFGMRFQNTQYQYYTDNPNYLYFNDSLTNSKKIHSYWNNVFYIGLDFKLNNTIAIGINVGTGFLYVPRNTSGIVPDLMPWTIYPTVKWKID